MFIDQALALSTAQAVTASAASTNYLDMHDALRDIGNATGDDLQFVVEVVTSFTAAGAATMTIQLQCAVDTAFTSPVIVSQTDAIPKATLVAGYQRFLRIPIGTNLRYVRLFFVVATGPMTAGALSAQIVNGVQASPIYPAVQP